MTAFYTNGNTYCVVMRFYTLYAKQVKRRNKEK